MCVGTQGPALFFSPLLDISAFAGAYRSCVVVSRLVSRAPAAGLSSREHVRESRPLDPGDMLRLFSSSSNHCHTCTLSRTLPPRHSLLRPPVLRSTRRRVLVALLVLWPLVLGRCCLAFAPTLLRTSHRTAGLRRHSKALGLRAMAMSSSSSGTAGGALPPPPLRPSAYKSTTLHIATFNVLAPVYKRVSEGQGRESSFQDKWRERANALCDLLEGEDLRGADVLCLQEVWARDDYMAILRERLGINYDLVFHQRPGMKNDGLLVLLKKGRFRLKKAQGKTLCGSGARVCLLLHLEVVGQQGEGLGFEGEVVVATTHLSFPNSALDRLSQRRQVLQLARALDTFVTSTLSQQQSDPPSNDIGDNKGDKKRGPLVVAVAGDFNLPLSDELLKRPLITHCGLVPALDSEGPQWVSHLTHRGEEVGVDHVLVREGWGPVRGEGRGRVRVQEAFVSPRGLRSDTWPSEQDFGVSDHRPVSALIHCGVGIEEEEGQREKEGEGAQGRERRSHTPTPQACVVT